MKKLFLLFAIAAVSFTACKKDDDTLDGESPSTTTPTVVTTPEEDKANMEGSGVAFVGEMKTMTNTPAMNTASSFSSLMGQDNVLESESGSTAKGSAISLTMQLINALVAVKENKASVVDVMKQMKGADTLELISEWNNMTQSYTWNATTQKWVASTNTSSILFNFPSTKTGTTNNASLEIKNFDAQVLTINGEQQEIPTSLDVKLTVDNSVVLSYDFALALTNGHPSTISSTLNISPFSMSVNISNVNDQTLSAVYSFKNTSKTLLELALSTKGNWSESNVKANQFNENDSVAIQNILTEGGAHIIFMDMKLSGSIAFANLYNAAMAVKKNPLLTEQGKKESAANLMNQYANLELSYVSSGAKIADAEAYAFEKTDDDSYCYSIYNETTQTNEQVCEQNKYWTNDVRIKFKDGSKADVKTYLEDGFDDIFTEMDNLIIEMNTKFDLDLQPINQEEEVVVKK